MDFLFGEAFDAFLLSFLLFDSETRLIALNNSFFAECLLGDLIVLCEGIITVRAKEKVLIDALFLVFIHSMGLCEFLKLLFRNVVVGRLLLPKDVIEERDLDVVVLVLNALMISQLFWC